MAITKVMFHGCAHETQDRLYGKSMRLFNECKGKTVNQWRCTVCGAVKGAAD